MGGQGNGHTDSAAATGPAPGFRHDALLYDTAEELTAAAAPFLLDGLAAGDGAVLAVGPDATAALLDALDGDPRVLVLERHRMYRARTPTAITTFRQLSEQAARGRRVRVVGEVDFGTTTPDRIEWQRYEAVINDALAPFPLWGLCVFQTDLPEPALSCARHTHPRLRTADGWTSNPDFVDPASYLRALPVPEEPLEDTHPALADDDITDFIGLRRAVRDRLATLDAPADLVEDYLLAVGEIMANALRHGRPPIGLRLWTAPGTLVCTITDTGPGWDDPFAGYGPAHGEDLSRGGMGVWLARQLCDHVDLRRDPAGVSVRLTSRWPFRPA